MKSMNHLTSCFSATFPHKRYKTFHKNVSTIFSAICLFGLLLTSHFSLANKAATESEKHSEAVKPEYVFKPADNPSAEVNNALLKAKAENKFALIVLGAQWCHDSVGLAENFSTEQMHTILSDRFITQFVDVAYLEDRRNITNLLAYPNYFATPTVLIVDPTNNTIMNIDSITTWQSAASVDAAEYLEHFSRWNKQEANTLVTVSKKHSALSAFETEQSARLQNGYNKLGPLLEASEKARSHTNTGDQETEEESQLLNTLWREVKIFRTQVQADIHEFRTSDISNAELNAKLAKAAIEQQSWEK